jgi:hypothetical protein
MDGSRGSGDGVCWLHQKWARKNESELYPSDFYVTTNGNHFYLCYLIYLRPFRSQAAKGGALAHAAITPGVQSH